MLFKRTDGGRADAGFKGKSGDCGTRAVAIYFQQPYRATYDKLGDVEAELTGGLCRSVRDGTGYPTLVAYMALRKQALTVCKGAEYIHELPLKGRFLVVLANHYATLIDNVWYDSWDSRYSKRTKHGGQKMLGYFHD